MNNYQTTRKTHTNNKNKHMQTRNSTITNNNDTIKRKSTHMQQRQLKKHIQTQLNTYKDTNTRKLTTIKQLQKQQFSNLEHNANTCKSNTKYKKQKPIDTVQEQSTHM